MARLTREEKYKIQEGLMEGLSSEEIAEKIGRTKTAINKYQQEFQKVANNFAKTNEQIEELNSKLQVLQQQLDEANTKLENKESLTNDIDLLDEVVLTTIHKLRQNGIKKEDAENALNKVTAKLTERIDDPSRLHALCMQQLSVHNTMITEAMGGREGVAIMTSAASQIIDEKKKNSITHTKTNRECLFHPKTGKVT